MGLIYPYIIGKSSKDIIEAWIQTPVTACPKCGTFSQATNFSKPHLWNETAVLNSHINQERTCQSRGWHRSPPSPLLFPPHCVFHALAATGHIIH